MNADHYQAGRRDFVAGKPLDADYGAKAVKRTSIFDSAERIAQDVCIAQTNYEMGRLAAAELRARRPRKGGW